jgi:sialic acid synthase SpsE/aryl-alcohol dehydrogenase-like predicted oxidoreductase
MKNKLISSGKLCLGSAQFGMDYGINNPRGKIPKKEVFEIFSYAYDSGVGFLDTASAYGESEKIIGEFHKNTRKRFNVISKFSIQGSKSSLRKIAEASLKNLHVDRLYGYCFHNFNDYRQKPRLLEDLNDLKTDGLIQKTGCSLYYPEELEFILSGGLKIDFVQVPYSIFDRRFEKYFEVLKNKGIEIHVRSVFLQGLVFKKPRELDEILTKTTDKIQRLEDLSQKSKIPIYALCLGFALSNRSIDVATVGVDSTDNLKEILSWSDYRRGFSAVKHELATLRVDDEQIVIPLNWRTHKAQNKFARTTNSDVFKIGGRQISDNDLFFVVEEGQANQGNFKKALRMVDAAATTGADAIEFQLAKAGDFYVKADPGYKIYLKREFSNEQLKELIAYTNKKGLEFIAVPLSHRLVKPLVKSGCSAFNINASDLTNPDIIDAVSESGLPFFLSVPLASEKEIEWAIKRIRRRTKSKFAVLHGQHVMASGENGVSVEHTTLGCIARLRRKYRVPIGFIDHTPLPWFPAVAVASGASIVSKHMTLSLFDKGPDWQVCLEPGQMKETITWARQVHKSIVMEDKNLAPGETVDKTIMRRSIVAAKDLKKGSVIQREDLCFKRPGTGLCSSRFAEVIGKKSLRNLPKDEQIKFLDLEGCV